MAMRRKRIGADNIVDARPAEVSGKHWIFHPHDGGIEFQPRNRLVE